MSRITPMIDGSMKEGSATRVWLVTGSASGLGRNIAEVVLASGDRLVATARDPRRLLDLVQKYGDQIRTAPLDVADEDAAFTAVQAAVDAFGRLDVVVNNAGYSDNAGSRIEMGFPHDIFATDMARSLSSGGMRDQIDA
jgi:NAD(P)-dependent dehydrogenase (short-subunit alcohol dehydrogenase family)